ncbi:MAG: hypothetical protein AAGC80_35795 [Rhodococcus sp. (in: high G+C Gram-positive bacteria)]
MTVTPQFPSSAAAWMVNSAIPPGVPLLLAHPDEHAVAPMLLKAVLVEGNTHAGVLASGQVVELLDDLPTC